MKTNFSKSSPAKGSSLIEAIIAVGVLAVAVPLVFGTMAESGEASLASQAETRSSWIVPACVEELQRAMDSGSQYLPAMNAGQDFPSDTNLAFSGEGKVIGKVSKGDYSSGLSVINTEPVRYIASMTGDAQAPIDGVEQNSQVKIIVEYPASAPAAKRQKLEFYTRMP